jgi:hypothetical protein
MLTFTTVGWILMAAVWLFVAFYVGRLIARVWNERVVRCPETGAITLVRIGPGARRDGSSPATEVRHCVLWQDGKEDCAQGCLARNPEDSPAYRVNVAALRPYER